VSAAVSAAGKVESIQDILECRRDLFFGPFEGALVVGHVQAWVLEQKLFKADDFCV
jgi:hypothetical protein